MCYSYCMTEKPKPKKKVGRPYAGGPTPQRRIRYGSLWDEAARAAEHRGETISAVVRRILDSELPKYLSGQAWHAER